MNLVPQTEARPFIFHARCETFSTRLTLLISSSILFAFSFFLLSFFISFSHEMSRFLRFFLYPYAFSSSRPWKSWMGGLPGGKQGHLVFHAKHGLKTCMEKPLTLFSTPSPSLFPETTHLPPLFTLSRLNRLPRAYLDALFQPQPAWNFFRQSETFISHESFFWDIRFFRWGISFFAGIHFFYASYAFIFPRLRLFLLLFIFFAFASSPLFSHFFAFLCFFAFLMLFRKSSCDFLLFY